MGFFDSVRRALHVDRHPARDVAGAWGLDDTGTASGEDPAEAGQYDRAQWRKKLKRVMEGLPATRGEWPDLVADARALSLDGEWIEQAAVDEFTMLVRRAVSDRHFTEEEHRKLDLARDLIGLADDRAEAILHAVVAEAERFFGQGVEGA